MVYSAPVLHEVGQAATLVLGFEPDGTDGGNTRQTRSVELALGLDE
jgi:hypothetical protein